MMPRQSIRTGLAVAAALALGLAGLVFWRLSIVAPATATRGGPTLYDFTVPDLDGHAVSLAEYRGRVVLVVNVASECGLAGQFRGLDDLYARYRDRGLAVLAFPSNDFWQEPNDESGIRTVCDARGVTFPVFARSHVRGAERSALYGFLAVSTGEAPIWNFAKYLVGRDGRPRAFFGSLVAPDHAVLTGAIERALAEVPPVEVSRD